MIPEHRYYAEAWRDHVAIGFLYRDRPSAIVTRCRVWVASEADQIVIRRTATADGQTTTLAQMNGNQHWTILREDAGLRKAMHAAGWVDAQPAFSEAARREAAAQRAGFASAADEDRHND